MTDDQRIDKLYESIREADAGISDDAMGEVRRLVALDKAIEVFKAAGQRMNPEDTIGLAADMEAFLAGIPFDDEDADEDDRGGIQ